MRTSFPLTVKRGRIQAALAALCAMAALAVVASVSPSSAHAEFSLKRCEGSKIQGEGSSLQKSAQLSFWDTVKIYLSETEIGCGPSAPEVAYHSASSGCGLDALGAGDAAAECSYEAEEAKKGEPSAGFRAADDRFGASDFAPNPVEEKNMEDGPNGAGQPGSDKVHVIPVAGAAITVVVHFPEGCKLEEPKTGTPASGVGSANGDSTTGGVNDPAGPVGSPNAFATTDSLAEETLRLHIPAKALEEIWEHKITEWGNIPTPTGGKLLSEVMTGSPTGQDASDTCADAPIYRIVRQDTSGTTYNFKAYLALLPSFSEDAGLGLWTSSNTLTGNTNTDWPLSGVGTQGAPDPVNSSNVCTNGVGFGSGNGICHALKGSGGSLATAVKETDGSIGYLDLATARAEGFTIEAKKADDTYWLPLEAINPNAANPTAGVDTGVFYEPTSDPTSHFNPIGSSTKGANCSEADYRGKPTTPASDPTLGDWSKAIATGGKAYPVCAITYDLAFDDDAAAYNNTSTEEEEKARTVKDYLTSVVSTPGQFELPQFDYAALPLEIVHIAESGVNAIGWNKSAGSGGGNSNNGNNGNSSNNNSSGGSTTGTTSTVVTPPSNVFSIAGTKIKGKDVVLSLVLPGAGKVQIKATGGGVTVANVSATVGGGQGTVTLPISGAAQKKLAKVKGHKLSVKITVTFTPTGGTAASKTKTITITQAAIAPKKKKKGKKKG
jgi:ABC-type phosphate transport system substrate-binding protein